MRITISSLFVHPFGLFLVNVRILLFASAAVALFIQVCAAFEMLIDEFSVVALGRLLHMCDFLYGNLYAINEAMSFMSPD